MKLIFALLLSAGLWLMVPGLGLAQGECVVSVSLVNHNRYAYKTEEECTGPFHSVPWGNWGVSSNVGSKRDADQFKGWDRDCASVKVQWNSCSINSQYRFATYLNFPAPESLTLLPFNGYPFSDSYEWNDTVPPYGLAYRVDQYSPCGPNVYGGVLLRLTVPPLVDYDGDGIADDGGCRALDDKTLTVRQNFMTIYELDEPDADDLIQSLFYPDLKVRLSCTPYNCFAADDGDRNGTPDDLNDPRSPAYQWPILYQDRHGTTCTPDDVGVPCKRLDATIRIGSVLGVYSGPLTRARRGRSETPQVSPARSGGTRKVMADELSSFALAHTQTTDRFVPVGSRVTGRIIEHETGNPVKAEIGIAVHHTQGITISHQSVNDDGWFALEDLPAGALYLSVRRDGFAAENRSLVITEGETPYLEMALRKTVTVPGVVTSQTGKAVADILVRALPVVADESFSAVWQWETGDLRTDESGRFVISVHPDKEYILAAYSSTASMTTATTSLSASDLFSHLILKNDSGTETELLRRFAIPALLRRNSDLHFRAVR